MDIRGAGMNDHDLRETLDALDQANKRAEVFPEEARRVLVEEGIYTKDGKLTPQYS